LCMLQIGVSQGVSRQTLAISSAYYPRLKRR
jgi:hypothetical protein